MSRKSKKRRKGKLKKRKLRLPGARLYEIPHPFANLSQAERISAAVRIGETKKAEFETLLKKVQNLLSGFDVLQVLSQLAYYSLPVGVSKEGEFQSREENGINQAHIEIAQALSLRIPVSELQFEPPHPNSFQELSDALIGLCDAFDLQRLAQAQNVQTEEEKHRFPIQEQVRSYTRA
ncbi:MAG TPA: hypothetical protein VGB89_05465, partial [Bacteroidota bacterium]